MNRILLVCLFVILNATLFAQLNMADSTVQIIGYWDKNETQSYSVVSEKYKIKEGDTLSRETTKYTVDITIVDSTADSYLIEWQYKDYEINSENALMKKIASYAKDMKVLIRTDEMGSFEEVVNWKELRDYMFEVFDVLKPELSEIPNMDQFIDQMKGMYATKEAIEAGVVQEIHQFYSFHGAKYEYGEEYNSDMKLANMYGGDPFDTKVTVWLDEMNPDDNNVIIRMTQTVDSEQLTQATLAYLIRMAETLKLPLPKKEDLPELSTETWLASRIHGSGWVVYSIETREIKAEGQVNVEERIIEII